MEYNNCPFCKKEITKRHKRIFVQKKFWHWTCFEKLHNGYKQIAKRYKTKMYKEIRQLEKEVS